MIFINACKEDFELLVIDKKPKTKMDSYGGKQIRIYSQWSCAADLEEIAIHEYAHHIHATEWWRGEFKGKYDAMHGYNFWFIYNKLINLAFQKGYNMNPKSYGIGTDFYNIYIRKFNQIDSNNFKKNIRL